MSNSGTPLSLTNGIYLQTKQFDVHMHSIDKNHLMRMDLSCPTDVTDLGMITPWIHTGYIERPGLFNMDNMKPNRMIIDNPNGVFKWEQPIAATPTRIVEICTEGEKLGRGGTTFRLKLNKRTFGNTAIIGVDKYSALQMIVTEDEIVGDDSTGYIYTVKLVATNAKQKFASREYLKPNTPIVQLGSVMTNHGQVYNTLGQYSAGSREFYNYVGQGTANVTYSVERDAANMPISRKSVINLKKYREVVEMYQFRPNSPGADAFLRGTSPLKLYEDKNRGKSNEYAYGEMMTDIVKKAWLPEVERLAMLQVERDVELYAIWGSGGTVQLDGYEEVHLPVGLFHQLNSGSSYTYSLERFTLEKLEAYITSRIKDKVEPYGNSVITIGTGRLGLKMVRPQIEAKANSMGMQFQAADYVSGSNKQTLHLESPNYNSYRWEFGTIKFEHIPALDPIEANDLENPIVNGERLSSGIFIIDDISGESGNIVELVYGANGTWDFQHRYINGKMDYMDTGRTFQSSSHHPGFEVFIEKRHKAYWVKDITKSLMIKPINPRTKKAIFEPVNI